MAAYVVKSWSVSNQPDENGQLVFIQGRSPGLLSWVLSLIGIEPTIRIQITDKRFVFESGSWSGRFSKTIPINKISSVYYGYSKPWKESLFWFVFLSAILGSLSGGLLVPVAALIALIYYFLNKALTVGVFEIGGSASGIEMKRSVIEGKKLGEEDAQQVRDILLSLIDGYNEPASSSLNSSTPIL